MEFASMDQSAEHYACILRITARVYPKSVYNDSFKLVKHWCDCFGQEASFHSDGTKEHRYMVNTTRGMQVSFTLN